MSPSISLKEFVENYFLRDVNDVSVALVNPVKTYLSSRTKKIEFFGTKSSLTLDEIFELQTTGKVKGRGKDGTDWTPIPMTEAEYFELFLRHTEDHIVCIDADGFKESGDVNLEQFWKIEGLPEFFKSLPYTLSRNKKLPHFYFKISNKDLSKLKNTYQDCFNCFHGDLLVNHAWEKLDRILYNFNEDLPTISWEELNPLFSTETTTGKELLKSGENEKRKLESQKKKEQKLLSKEQKQQDKEQKQQDKLLSKEQKQQEKLLSKEQKQQEKLQKKQEKEEEKEAKQKKSIFKISQKISNIIDIILKIDKTFFDTYDNWSKLGYIIYNETNGLGRDLFLDYSENKFDKFDEESFDKLWNSANENHSNPIKFGSLVEWLKELDPKNDYFQKSGDLSKDELFSTDFYKEEREKFQILHFKLDSPLCYCKLDDKENIIFYNTTEMREYCMDKFSTYSYKGSIGTNYIDFFDLWREDPNKKSYSCIEYEPNPEKQNKKNFNLFQGFSNFDENVEPIKEEDSKFLELLKYLCVKDVIYEYMKSWVSHLIQKPYKKSNVSPILYSKIGGIGKNAFVDGICLLLGEKNWAMVESIDDITKNFNSHLCNKVFIYGDEINANAKKVADKLKQVITRPFVNFEKKGFDTQKLNDFTNWLFTTNNENCFKVEAEDRRLFFIRCPEIPLSSDFYISLYDEINDPVKIKQLFAFFHKYVSTGGNKIGIDRVPSTDYKVQLQYENTPAYIQMLYKSPGLFANRSIKSTTLHKEAVKYAKDNHLSTNFTITTFGTGIRKYIDSYRKRNSTGVEYVFPEKDLIRKNLFDIDKVYYRLVNGLVDGEPDPTFETN